jgi:hypothetical protein
MNSYMVLIQPFGIYVKERDFFLSQNGHKEPWGKNWVQIEADSIEHARDKGKLIKLEGK